MVNADLEVVTDYSIISASRILIKHTESNKIILRLKLGKFWFTIELQLHSFFATSQTVYLFLPHLTDGTARIYFHRERNLYENSCHLMPRPGFELMTVELAPLCGTLIQARFSDRSTATAASTT